MSSSLPSETSGHTGSYQATENRPDATPAAEGTPHTSPEHTGTVNVGNHGRSEADVHAADGHCSRDDVPDRQDGAAGHSAVPDHPIQTDTAASGRIPPSGSGAYIFSRQRDVPLANANIVPLPLDVQSIRSILTAIETALEREGAFQQLRLDYADLQQQLRSAELHIADLDRQFNEAALLASPFVQYCQHRYDMARQDLRESRRQYDEVVAALADHEGDRLRIAALEDQLQAAQQQLELAIGDRDRTIGHLTDQLAAALLQTPTASLQDLQRLRSELDSSMAARADLQQALQQLTREIDGHTQTRLELAETQDSNSALVASQEALEGAVEQLKRQVGTVQQNMLQLRMSADANLDLVVSQRDQARTDLHNRDVKLRRAHGDRDRARDEMQTYKSHVDSARQSVARLEKRVADLQSSADDLHQLRAENASLQADLTSEQQRRAAAEAERDRLLIERDTIGQKLAGLSSLVQARPPNGSGSNSPTARQPPPQKRSRSRPEDSRSPHKRPRSSSGSSTRPIQIDSEDDDDDKSEGNSGHESKNSDQDQNSGRSNQGSVRPQPDRAQSGGTQSGSGNNNPPSPSSSDSSGESSDSGSPGPSGLLSDNALNRLPATAVGRGQWIPGYRRPQDFARHDVLPWPVTEVRLISVRRLTVDILFRDWSCPELWLFPGRQPRPHTSRWNPELITETNVRALYDAEPWTVLQTPVIPHSFDLVGWFTQFALQYTTFEEDHLQTLWESTHHFPVTAGMRQANAYLDQFNHDRKQRRSRAGPRWKKILELVHQGMIQGHCDLDLLLDPFILHFPRRNTEYSTWYPGRNARVPPADLLEALTPPTLGAISSGLILRITLVFKLRG